MDPLLPPRSPTWSNKEAFAKRTGPLPPSLHPSLLGTFSHPSLSSPFLETTLVNISWGTLLQFHCVAQGDGGTQRRMTDAACPLGDSLASTLLFLTHLFLPPRRQPLLIIALLLLPFSISAELLLIHLTSLK